MNTSLSLDSTQNNFFKECNTSIYHALNFLSSILAGVILWSFIQFSSHEVSYNFIFQLIFFFKNSYTRLQTIIIHKCKQFIIHECKQLFILKRHLNDCWSDLIKVCTQKHCFQCKCKLDVIIVNEIIFKCRLFKVMIIRGTNIFKQTYKWSYIQFESKFYKVL